MALEEGATTINVPDTVGYTMPHEYAAMFEELTGWCPTCAILSSRCTATTTWAWRSPTRWPGSKRAARQVECAINGIGERAGNASLEEIVMLLHTREPSLGLWTGIETTEIARTSRLVSRLTGYPVQPNKAIVGRNAFAHEAGIHQDGVLKERTTYEIMDATTVGLALERDRAGQALRSPRAARGAPGAGHPGRRPGAERGVQALQGDRRPQEVGHGDGPGGARRRRAARRGERRRTRCGWLRGATPRRSEAPRASVRSRPRRGGGPRRCSRGATARSTSILPRDQRGQWRGRGPARVPLSTRSPGPGRAGRGVGVRRGARARPAPARAYRRTSSRRRRAQTCGRCRLRSPAQARRGRGRAASADRADLDPVGRCAPRGPRKP